MPAPNTLFAIGVMLGAAGAGICFLDWIGRTFANMHGPTRRDLETGLEGYVPEGMKVGADHLGRGSAKSGADLLNTQTKSHSSVLNRTGDGGAK